MPTEARHIRTLLDDLSPPRHRTTRELDQEARIVTAATAAFARFGRSHITLANFAAGLRLSPATIRRHFPDLHTLLAEILRRHLLAIATAIGDANPDPLAPHAGRQAAYIAATRNGFGAPIAPHILLLRDRHTLPEDLAEPIDQLRLQIGDLLAGPRADLALAILDEPTCPEPEALTLLATLSPTPHLTVTPIPPATTQSQPAAPTAQPAAAPPASRHRPSRTPASRLPPAASHAARQACAPTPAPIPDPGLSRQTARTARRQACAATLTPIADSRLSPQIRPAPRRQACAPTPTPVSDARPSRQTTPATHRQACFATPTGIADSRLTRQTASAARRQACAATPTTVPDSRLSPQIRPAPRRQACAPTPTPVSDARPSRQTAPAARRQACAATPTRHRPPNLPTPALPIRARAGPAPPG